jgi:hypothetical protein
MNQILLMMEILLWQGPRTNERKDVPWTKDRPKSHLHVKYVRAFCVAKWPMKQCLGPLFDRWTDSNKTNNAMRVTARAQHGMTPCWMQLHADDGTSAAPSPLSLTECLPKINHACAFGQIAMNYIWRPSKSYQVITHGASQFFKFRAETQTRDWH